MACHCWRRDSSTRQLLLCKVLVPIIFFTLCRASSHSGAHSLYKALFPTTGNKLKNTPWPHLHFTFKMEFIMHSRAEIPSVLDGSQMRTTARFSRASSSVWWSRQLLSPKLYLWNYSNASLRFFTLIPNFSDWSRVNMRPVSCPPFISKEYLRICILYMRLFMATCV